MQPGVDAGAGACRRSRTVFTTFRREQAATRPAARIRASVSRHFINTTPPPAIGRDRSLRPCAGTSQPALWVLARCRRAGVAHGMRQRRREEPPWSPRKSSASRQTRSTPNIREAAPPTVYDPFRPEEMVAAVQVRTRLETGTLAAVLRDELPPGPSGLSASRPT